MRVSLLIQRYKLTLYLFLLVVVSISISRQLFIFSLWPWLLSWILEDKFREKFRGNIFIRRNFPFWSLCLMFILYGLSILWSKNKSYGIKEIGQMATLIIIPFFLVFSSDTFKRRESVILIFKAFILGMVISSLHLIFVALTKSLSFENGKILFTPAINDWENVFFNSNFTYLIHTSYYSMMLIMAVSVCLYDIRMKLLLKSRILIPGILSVFFSVMVFLTQSRSAFLALLAIVLYQLIIFRIRLFIKFTVFLIIVVLSIIYLSNAFRFKSLKDNFSSSTDAQSALFHSNIRDTIWSSTMLIIKKYPVLGVGLGDQQDELNAVYKKYNLSEAYENHLNCHNQFLQTWLSTGVVGLCVLLISLFYPLALKNYKLKTLYASFVLLIIIMFFFESMLERVWGIAFFSIFYTLLQFSPEILNE